MTDLTDCSPPSDDRVTEALSLNFGKVEGDDRFDFRDTPADEETGGYEVTDVLISSYQTGGSGGYGPMADEDHKTWIDIVSFGTGTPRPSDEAEDGILV